MQSKKIHRKSLFTPRDYQSQFFQAMETKKRAFLLLHRRAGKDVGCWNYLIKKACEKVAGSYFYILPTYAQAKRVIWDGLLESGLRMLDFIPPEFIDGKPNQTEMKIRLKNGSIIQLIGAENYDSIRGTNPKGVVLSEFAMQQPKIWTEVLSPILLKNGGWAVFNTTPMGKNHAFDLWAMAEHNKDWFTQKLTVEDTGLITQEQIESQRAEGKPEDIIQQEYYCSWSRGIEGSYYAKLMHNARADGRVGYVPIDPYSKVYTYWDLGVSDSTAIWFAQFIGNEIHLVNHYENSGEGLNHYIKELDVYREKNNCIYGGHYAPHDIQQRELSTGISRLDTARSLGIKFDITPNILLADGIDAVRSILHRCWFNQVACAKGIKALENYRKVWNDKLGVYSDRPLHDHASHSGDAFRYLAVNVKRSQTLGNTTLSSDEWQRIRNRNMMAG